MIWDVLIAGAGPAGAACAAFCAQAGLSVLVLERAEFPRDKVCGDCLNPSCWPVLDRLGATGAVLALPHSRFDTVEIATLSGKTFRYPLRSPARGEIAVKRSLFDAVLARRAVELGAEIAHGHALTAVERSADGALWNVRAGEATFTARQLVAADGRNSTVARLLGRFPAAARERVALQTHLPAPAGFGEKVRLQLLPQGYCGVASVGGGQLNLCLIGKPADLPALRHWAADRFPLAAETEWRTITPLARAPLPPVGRGNAPVLIGDAARVVEPFTGEGIYYAMATAELAATYLAGRSSPGEFRRACNRLYAGRLWVNRLTRWAVTHPRLASRFLERGLPGAETFLRFLTAKVVEP